MNRQFMRLFVVVVGSALACTVGKDGAPGAPGVPCSGCVTSASIAPGAVSTTALGDGVVHTPNIAAKAVTGAQLADGAVDAAQLAPNAVGTAIVADGAITVSKFAPGAVDANALAAGSVGATQLASGAVGTAQIATGAVGGSQIAPKSVSAGHQVWPLATAITFLPNVPTAGCATPAVGGTSSGSTVSATAVTIGTMFLDLDNVDLGLRAAFSRARFIVRCRGPGTLQVASSNTGSCNVILATITCGGGGRPWTASSNEFAISNSMALNLLATANAGTLEWADPALILY